MTNEMDTSRSRSEDAEAAAAVARTDDDAVNVDATVVPVDTFAAGQSANGRYLAATAAPQGSFADGQLQEDEAASPEAPPSRAD